MKELLDTTVCLNILYCGEIEKSMDYIFTEIINNIKNTDYRFMAMLSSYVLGLFSFNWVEKTIKYTIRKIIKYNRWIREGLDKKKHKQYDLSANSEYTVRSQIKVFLIYDKDGVDSLNKEILSCEEIEKYVQLLNEFLHYQTRILDRNLESEFEFGLYVLVDKLKLSTKRKVKDIMPKIEKHNQQYVSVFKIKTYEKLSRLEIQEITEAIKNNLFYCFAEVIEQTVIRTPKFNLQLQYVYDDEFKLILI